MALLVSQEAILLADIAADPVLSAVPHTTDGAFVLAAAYVLPATPDFWVYKTQVTEDTLLNEVSPDGTTFNLQGNGFITRSAGEHFTWSRLFVRGWVNPSLAHIRSAFADILSGTGNAAANRTHCLAQIRRLATRIEQLFATGTGSAAAPAVMGWEGPIHYSDIETAWAHEG